MRIRFDRRTARLRANAWLWSRHRAILRNAAVSALAIGVLDLAGCTMGPDYKRPEVPMPAAWRTDVPEVAVDNVPDAANVVNTAWWKAFGDPELTALIEAALDSNKDLKLATLRIEEYDARLDLSRAPNYPQFRYSSGTDRERRSEERPNGLPAGASATLNNFEVFAAFSWELDIWGRIKRSNEASLANLLSTEEARRATMLTVATSVATSYIQLVELDRELALAQQTLKNRVDATTLVDQKYKGGSTTRLAVEQAQAVADAESARIPQIEQQIATAENALSILLGRNPGRIPRRPIDALALPRVPAGIPSDVLRRRPDVLAAEQTLVAANALIGVAKAEYFPALSLTGALGLGSDELKYLWAHTARTTNIGARITGPLFNGGKVDADVREAEAVQKQMVVRYEQAVQTALQEVDSSLVSRIKAAEREQAFDRQVGSLQRVQVLSKARYEGGQSTLMEVLDADFKLIGAQTYQSQGRRDTFLALISVYKAMGGGWMVEQEQLRMPAPPASGAEAPVIAQAGAEK